MTSVKGYRLKISNIMELSAMLDDFRANALKNLGKQYGSLVAKKAVEALDRDRMGIEDLSSDPFTFACQEARKSLGRSSSGLIAPELNCCIRFHFVHDAILATFSHGNPDYLKQWESNKQVINWGWSPDGMPSDISESTWRLREKYWTKALSRKLGGDLQFILIDRQLPDIGWGAIWRYLPSMEERIAVAIEALKGSDPTGLMQRYSGQKLQEIVLRSIEAEVNKNSFQRSSRNKSAGAKKIREEVAQSKKPSAAKDIERKIEEKSIKPIKATEIDHADVIIASDNRIFVAVPYVGFEHDSRVFLQVSEKHVAFSQNGVQFGFVDNIKPSSLDLLRSTKQVILVEIEKNYEERLLRAKHMAIVTDISLQQGFGSAINRFRDFTNTSTQEKELKEWERQQ